MAGPGGVERFLLDLPFRKGVDGLLVADAPGARTSSTGSRSPRCRC
jgi:hypothetical protein